MVCAINPAEAVSTVEAVAVGTLGGQLTEWFRQRIAEPGILPAFLYFTRVAECSTRRKRTSWSSLPKWLRPFDPNGFQPAPIRSATCPTALRASSAVL